MEHLVEFPGLGLSFTLNRIAFQIGGLKIYWYGIIICFGFLLGVLYINRHAKDYGFTADNVYDCLFLGVPVAIICARAYFVIFRWQEYQGDFLKIIDIRRGGLAIYGGVAGAVIAIVIYGRWKHLNIPDMGDLVARGLLIGQGIGRWGNFINAEAHGGQTELPWRMVIDGTAGVHPTFFYESAWNLLGFLVLHFWSKKRRFSGEIFLGYLAWYGFGRMLIEGLRTDSLYFGSLRISQVVAFLTFVMAVCIIIWGRRARRPYAVPTEIHLPNNGHPSDDDDLDQQGKDG